MESFLCMHITCVTWGNRNVLSPTIPTELGDEDSLGAPDLSVCYRITGSEIK